MSLSGRDYMRGGGGAPLEPQAPSPVTVTNALIVVNVIAFALQGTALTGVAIMQPAAVFHGEVWRLLTATYLHASAQHLFANMLGLYFLGPVVEMILGRAMYALLYTAGGIAGNLVYALAAALGFMDTHSLGLGASGSILAIIGAAAILAPDARVYVYMLVPIRLRTFAVIYGLTFVINILNRGPNWGGDLCHLAGVIVGAGWAYVLVKRRFPRMAWR